MNWPTAFVISTIIIAGAFLYSERTDAGIMGGERMIAAIGNGLWQLDGTRIRVCMPNKLPNIKCGEWVN
jgi:hypothetical protein